jgi:hypothetical protein
MRHVIVIVVFTALLLMATKGTRADTNGTYDLTWFSIDGGGGQSSGSGYALIGTLGQPDAGVLSGGGYQLAGGFWPAATSQNQPVFSIYLPLVMK